MNLCGVFGIPISCDNVHVNIVMIANVPKCKQMWDSKAQYDQFIKIKVASQVLVAHTYKFSYLEDWHQKDCGLRPAQANSSQDPISKITEQNGLKW
jgi:hypothetical protein